MNSGATGITINAGANDLISLQGLIIEGAGVGQNGVLFLAGSSLTIDSCVICHVTNTGILFQASASSSLSVWNVLVADNGGDGIAIAVAGASGAATAAFTRVVASNNLDGISVSGGDSMSGGSNKGTATAVVTEVVAYRNANFGFFAFSDTGASTNLMVLRSVVAANNLAGVGSSGASVPIRISQSSILD